MKKLFFFTIFSLFTFNMFSQTIVSTDVENKKVILEEFTGIHCGFCPEGHVIAQSIIDNNPGDAFVVNIHTGGYANPSAGEPDFRTEYGDAIAGQSGLTGYPAGTVNRHVFPGYQQGSGTAQSRGSWSTTSNQILGQESYLNVGIEAEIDRESRVATIHVEVYYTGDSPEATNLLNIMILQDNTLGPQSGGSNPYNHMHRLIEMPTGQWGMEIPETSAETFVDETFEFTIPVNTRGVPIILDDLKFVAFVTETHQEIVSGNGCDPTYVGTALTNDISLDEIIVEEMVCAGEFPVSVSVSNYGSSGTSSLEITYQVNDEAAEVYNWSGSLGSLETVEIELPTVNYTPLGTNTFEVTIESDENIDNNTQSTEVLDAETGITWVLLKFDTDDNGNQFVWQMKESDGSIVQSGSNYDNNESYVIKINADPDCYRLEMHDSGENGGTSVVLEDAYSELYSIDGNWGGYALARFKTEIAEVGISFVPADGSTNVSVAQNIRIKFDQPVRNLDNSPIVLSNPDLPVTLKDADDNDIPFALNMSSDRTKLTLNPTDDLDLDVTYTVEIEAGCIENNYDMPIAGGSASFTTSNEVSVDEPNNEINIFPNPAKNELNITNANNSTIEIYNILGSLIFSSENRENNYKVNLSEFAQGNYILKIHSDDNVISKKFNIVK